MVESDALPETPQPNQIHNDKYWDERSLDREISDLSDEKKDLRENRKILSGQPAKMTIVEEHSRMMSLILTIAVVRVLRKTLRTGT